jgi:nicotinamidase-related amidase
LAKILIPDAAILLIDLQTDFLDWEEGRMPVDRMGSEEVIKIANEILAKKILPDALPVLIMSKFPLSARIANLFRKNAALVGSPGADIDERILMPESTVVFEKIESSAFSNPEVTAFLKNRNIKDLFILGVFAEGCVRATVLDAIKIGFNVCVIENAVATNAPWKKQFALWVMNRAGALVEKMGV